MGHTINNGRVPSQETRRKISIAMKGKTAGDRNSLWKGDDVGYQALHMWVRRWRGKASKCINCNKNAKAYDWANVSREYKRELDDWIELCRSCHIRYDSNTDKQAMEILK